MRLALRIALVSFLLTAGLCLAGSLAHAKKSSTSGNSYRPTSSWSEITSLDSPAAVEERQGLAASAVATTIVLNSSKFDSGASCTANSWTSVDLTQQSGDYWHVDDMAGLIGFTSTGGIAFVPIQGSKSLWMGARPSASPPLCSYASLPGYGNNWNQSFCSKDCVTTAGGPTPNLDVAFLLHFDSEPSYDATRLEYTTDCTGNSGWTGISEWRGAGQSRVLSSIISPGANPVKVRLRFTSDASWSNEDGMYAGFGAMVDSLSLESTPVEDFEDEALGATSSNDWQSCNTPGFGNYLALFKKNTGANYEDLCLDNLGCYWAAINGSTEFYNCGTPPQPSQKIVPHKNASGQYLANEIWSPVLPFGASTGSDVRLRFTVYRDLPLGNLVFFVWHVRTTGASGCPGPWKDSGYYYYGDTKDWTIVEHAVGSKLDLNGGVSMQAAIGVIDMCPNWCGVLGSGACHSPAPYIDSVKVLRINTVGPQWDVRAVDTFQDTFASDGTLTGKARVDEAMDVAPAASPSIAPGDSGVVRFVVDPVHATAPGTLDASGLSDDPVTSTFIGRDKTKKAVYMYVAVWPKNQPAKVGAPVSEGPGGQANRYPFMGTQIINAVTWTKIRMDYTYVGTSGTPGLGTGTQPRIDGSFNVDLNDALYAPGDTICYFFSATSPDGTNYFSTEFGTTTDITAIAANPMELTILPAGGYNRGGQLLYVDAADGLGIQPYFDGALIQLHLLDKTDRYDVRDPAAAAGNRLAGRVKNVAAQLNAAYRFLVWDTGALHLTLGDGSGSPEKANDYGLLNTFLGNLTAAGGVFMGGDDLAETLNASSSASAATFRTTYMPFTLINGNHRLAPSMFPISPTVAAWPGRAFTDNFYVFGGCPELNDFDVMGASGTSRVEMSYNTASNTNGGVLSKQTVNGNGKVATVIMAGFSMGFVRDNELDGVSDRTKYLRDALFYLGFPFISVGAGDSPPRTMLSQNYPNPFNPQTTIAYTIAKAGHVEIAIYDVGGRLVRTLANETHLAGTYEAKWDGRDGRGQQVASGVYFYRLVAPEFTQTKKMVLLK